MRAVAVVVHRIGVPIGKVPAEDVVDEAVAVVVDTIAGDLTRVSPGVGGQVAMGVVDAGVDHGDHHAAGASRGQPGRRRVDVGVDDTTRLSGVVQPPERAERRIVGDRGRRDHEVGFHGCHERGAASPPGHVGHARARCGEREEPLAQRLGPPAGRKAELGGAGGRCLGNPGIGMHLDNATVPVDLPRQAGRVGREHRPGLERLHPGRSLLTVGRPLI